VEFGELLHQRIYGNDKREKEEQKNKEIEEE